jgi:trimeric autotransporter adhesin
VAFQAPATVASNVTWTLPDADGTDGQVIKTNGTGTLSWITPSAGGGGTSVTVTQATATAAQTDFSVTYTVGQLSVYLNGALLASADYTASNGTTVVLAAGAASGDIFTAVAYDSATQITQGDTAVEVSDTGSDGTITGTADNTAVFSVEKGKTFVLQGGVSSTGVGIAFPADQTTVGASSDANTLDDYEEGTWTPLTYLPRQTRRRRTFIGDSNEH